MSANRIAVFRGLVHVLVLQSYSHIKFSLQFSSLLFSCPSAVFFFSVFQTDFSNKKRFWSKNKGKDFLPASKSRRNDHSEENRFQYLFGALFVFEDRNEQCEPVL